MLATKVSVSEVVTDGLVSLFKLSHSYRIFEVKGSSWQFHQNYAMKFYNYWLKCIHNSDGNLPNNQQWLHSFWILDWWVILGSIWPWKFLACVNHVGWKQRQCSSFLTMNMKHLATFKILCVFEFLELVASAKNMTHIFISYIELVASILMFWIHLKRSENVKIWCMSQNIMLDQLPFMTNWRCVFTYLVHITNKQINNWNYSFSKRFNYLVFLKWL